jgi:hypothetical protein
MQFAAVGLHDSMRSELKRKGASGVNCTLVCPFYIRTGAVSCGPWAPRRG